MFKFLTGLFKMKPLQLKDQENFRKQLPGFKAPGYTAASLKKGGFPAWAVKSAGYTLKEMKEAGYSARALKMAGFPKEKVDAEFKK